MSGLKFCLLFHLCAQRGLKAGDAESINSRFSTAFTIANDLRPRKLLTTNGMSNALADGDRMEIRGLCWMFVKQYDAYTGRNPKTGALTETKPKNQPFFKCGKELKERVDI